MKTESEIRERLAIVESQRGNKARLPQWLMAAALREEEVLKWILSDQEPEE